VTDPASAPTLWQALNDAGGRPFGLDAIEIARVEAGLVIIGLDYQVGATSPWDVSLDRVIKTDTENVGAQALATAGAEPQKRFKTLRIEGDAVPEAGAPITKDGAQVGTVTSPATSPVFGVIALAILDSGVATDGEKVDVAGAAATVAPLSIHDPEKKKTRS
jgi:aminomethyltransferase